MAAVFYNVLISTYCEDDSIQRKSSDPHKIELEKNGTNIELKICNDNQVTCIVLKPDTEVCRLGKQSAVVTEDQTSTVLRFPSIHAVKSFLHQLKELRSDAKSVFRSRTDDASAVQYFQFYGYLSQQQNMMQDYIRTSTYQRAMLANVPDFHDKVVLDVGAGSGILSFFAIQAGARKVYAVEASSMAQHCERLVHDNKLGGRIIVIPGKVEEVEIPEKVDTIISEPMGYMLFNERMLESFLHAKKWLKPDGKMFPTLGDLHIAPFTDEALFMEQCSKANFWYQQSFHGVDLTILRDAAEKEYFKQPIVDTFDIRICMAKSVKYTVDFQTAEETDLHVIEIPVSFNMLQSGLVHGLAFWFDVAFLGSRENIWLSTVPTEPLTHWYQVRCLLQTPILVKYGQTLTGKVTLRCNSKQSYDVDIEMNVPGTSAKSVNSLDLKNPFFRYNGQVPIVPPGTSNQSPSDLYWMTGGSGVQGQNQVQGHSLDLSVIGQGGYVNGTMNGGQEVSMTANPQNVVHANLIPLSSAPINPGSIPSVMSVANNSNANRTSVGAGISPIHFSSTQNVIYGGTTHFPVSNQFMIGDYVMPGNVLTSGQYKSSEMGGV